ncbi:hypothetical protein D9M71_824350 [compost metagenome]
MEKASSVRALIMSAKGANNTPRQKISNEKRPMRQLCCASQFCVQPVSGSSFAVT